MEVYVGKICLAVYQEYQCCPQSCLHLSTCRSSETCPVQGLMSRDSIWSVHYNTVKVSEKHLPLQMHSYSPPFVCFRTTYRSKDFGRENNKYGYFSMAVNGKTC